MPEMAATTAAGDFGAYHAVAAVFMLDYGFFLQRLVKTGPARTGIIFGIGTEQGFATNTTKIRAIAMLVPVLTAERALRALLAADAVFLGIEIGTPFGVGLHHLVLAHDALLLLLENPYGAAPTRLQATFRQSAGYFFATTAAVTENLI